MLLGIKKKINNAKALTGDNKQKAFMDMICNAKSKHLSVLYEECGDDIQLKEAIFDKARSYISEGNNYEICAALEISKEMELGEQFDMLSKTLKSEVKNVRKATVNNLVDIKDERVVELLIAALDDEATTVRFQAAGALGDVGDKRAAEPLIKLIRQSFLVSCDAVEALGKLKDKRAVEPLFDGYAYHKENNNQIVCKAILKALIDLDAISDNIDKVGSWLDYDVIPEYEDVLTALAETKDRRAIPYIIDVKRPIYSFSLFAHKVDCLGKLELIEVAEPIINWVVYSSKPNSWNLAQVKLVGVDALLKLPQDEVLRIFIAHSLNLLASSRRLLHSILTDFFEQFTLSVDDKKAVPVLCSMLNENKDRICCAAAKALGRLQDESSIPFLEEAAQNANKKVSKAAREALGVLLANK